MTAQTLDAFPHAQHGRQGRAKISPARAVLALMVTLMLGAALTVAGAGPASAADEPQNPQGWARVAHLSPDTKSVDVALMAVAGGQVLFDLEDVAYGDVSDYLRLPVGAYVVDMVPTGSADGTAPALSQLINVKEDQPITMAVLGTNAELTAKVVTDDLTPPAGGSARVRVIQASTVAGTVDIQTVMGVTIAAGVKSGEVTGYATVEDGSWDLQLFVDAKKSLASIDLESGSVNTLLVLDNASGGLTVKAIVDSSSVTETPVGGTNTGAVPAETSPLEALSGSSTTNPATPWVVLLLVVAIMGAVVVTARSAPQAPLPVRSRRRR